MKALLLLSLIAATGLAAAQPATLAETGLDRVETTAFTPRYPLWSDGSDKRRWLHLPPGTSIDTSRPDEWVFPAGTMAWKEFSRDGQKIETRLIERLADGSWRYAAYEWNASGTEGRLAPEAGVPAKGIPSRADCLACHEGTTVPILGYSAVQLATSLPPAAGYLHGNCGHCHNDSGPLANVGLALQQSSTAPGARPKRTLTNLIVHKMRSPNPLTRMPPLGVSIPDAEGIALVERWMQDLETRPEERR